MEGYSEDGVPLLNESNYESWSIRMKYNIQAREYDIWKSIEGGAAKKPLESNEKALSLIMMALSQSEKERLNVGMYTSAKDLWSTLESEHERKIQDMDKEKEVKTSENGEQGMNEVQASSTSEGKNSSIGNNSKINDDEVAIVKDEEDLLKIKEALASTLLDRDVKSNSRLRKKIMGAFEKYQKETKDLFLKLKLKNNDLQGELEDKNLEVKRLKNQQGNEQDKIDVDPRELEETRWVNLDLKIQLEEAKKREEVLKSHLDEKKKKNEELEMEVVGIKKKIEKSNYQQKFNSKLRVH